MGRRRRAAAHPATRSSRSSSPTAWASTPSGRSSTTSSRSTRTRAPPSVFLGRRLAAHAAHPPGLRDPAAAARLPASRARGRDAPRCSTSSPAGASSSAPARRRAAPSSTASASTARPSARSGRSALDVVTRMMVEEPFAGADGRFLTMPPRNVVPKPVQKPHPPLWVACSRRETIRLAAEKGIGALTLLVRRARGGQGSGSTSTTRSSSRERCVPGGFAVNPQVAVRAADDVRARRGARRSSAASTARTSSATRWRTTTSSATTARAHEHLRGVPRPPRRASASRARSSPPTPAPLGVQLLQQGLGSLRGAIGTPEQVRDLCRRYEAAGVDQLIFVMQAGRNRHEHICESIELFASEVMPEFAAARRRGRRAARRALRAGDRGGAGAPRAAARRRPRLLDRARRLRARRPSGRRARAVQRPPRARSRVQALLADQGERAFKAFVRRSDDRRLERTAGLGRRAEGALRRDGAGLRARQGRGLQRRPPVRPAARERRARELDGHPRARARERPARHRERARR